MSEVRDTELAGAKSTHLEQPATWVETKSA